MKFRSQFNYPVSEGIGDFPPSLTQQQFAEDTDINVILERFRANGSVPPGTRIPEYVDFSNAPTSFREALGMVDNARLAFMQLPADIRARLGHDPGRLEEFLLDPANREELLKRGFVKPSTSAEPTKDNPPSDNAPSANGA